MARLGPHRAEAEIALKIRSSRVAQAIGIFLLWWILTALVYHDTQSNFLRSESGWYLFLSQSPPVVQSNFQKDALTMSFKGHYTPLGFLAEFATAKLVGTRGWFWKWRQITAVALLATMFFLFARTGGSALQLPRAKASFSAFGLTALLIFQPQMREFVAWPYMILQLGWLLCSTVALLGLVQMALRPTEIVWPWLTAGAAYTSLHFLGLGIATLAATGIGMAALQQIIRRATPSDASKLTVPFLTMIALGALHAGIMWKFPRPDGLALLPGWQPLPFLAAALGFIPNFALATLRSLFSTSPVILGSFQTTPDWPYGLAILLAFWFLLGCAFFQCLREPTARNRARLILQSFSSMFFLALIAMIAIRQWREPTTDGFASYLVGARYLIPSTFALAGIRAEFFFLVATAPIFLNALLNLSLGVCAILGHLQYAAHVYPKTMPLSMISHDLAWRSVVAMGRECRDANLAIPNVPLGALTQDFYDWDLKLFEPLLRADLKLPPGTSLQLRSWEGLPDEYYRDVPSLAQVKKRLLLETKN